MLVTTGNTRGKKNGQKESRELRSSSKPSVTMGETHSAATLL